jgi:catechol 2,3-dioxygenase-like lactoylglutathione lyase family enzyme
MEVLSSRVLLAPRDFEATVRWYLDVLGLSVYREYGEGGHVTGVVCFLGGGFLELHRGGESTATTTLWLQVAAVDDEYERLVALDEARITAPPKTMPWGLREMWLEDPDGTRIVVVEVPQGHPLRTRLDLDR